MKNEHPVLIYLKITIILYISFSIFISGRKPKKNKHILYKNAVFAFYVVAHMKFD